jgi:ornithine cyclodeaminase/alanine dehydrogenase-like protein (mu-crystallin family)
MTMPRVLSSREVSRALAGLDVPAIVRAAFIGHHEGESVLPEEAVLRWTADDGGAARSIAMHAYLPGPSPTAGLKVINAAIGNPDRGLPRASGTIALFDTLTAEISTLLPAAEISAARTAAVSTLAALHLSPGRPRRLAILGAGTLAKAHLKMLGTALPLQETVVFDLRPERAVSLAEEAREGSVADDPREAVAGSDVVLTTTTVTEPYLEWSWLKRGAVVLNISLDDLPAEPFLRADRLYVDDWKMVTADRRRMLGRLAAAGQVSGPGEVPPPGGRAVTGTLGALFAGRAEGRRTDDETIVVNPFGLAISDIALATAVVEAVAEQRRQVGKAAHRHRPLPA